MLGKLEQYSFIQQVFAKCLPCARRAIDSSPNEINQARGPLELTF